MKQSAEDAARLKRLAETVDKIEMHTRQAFNLIRSARHSLALTQYEADLIIKAEDDLCEATMKIYPVQVSISRRIDR